MQGMVGNNNGWLIDDGEERIDTSNHDIRINTLSGNISFKMIFSIHQT